MEELSVEAKLENISTVSDFVCTHISNCPVKIQNDIMLAIDEIFSNIANYAYNTETGYVTVRITVKDDIAIEFEDSGIAYNPLSSVEPDITLPARERKIGGLGIFMVKKIMDSMEYRREGNKNILAIKKAVIKPEDSHFEDPRDGRVYKTMKIGTQIWMAENLNYNASGSIYYENNPANGEKYGRLYDWKAAKEACLPDWHLPSNEEWQILVDFAGGEKVAGRKLKAKSDWYNHSNGTDEFGFSALPGGIGHSDGSFSNIGDFGYWWSITEHSSYSSYYRSMNYSHSNVYKRYILKSSLLSVRCIRD